MPRNATTRVPKEHVISLKDETPRSIVDVENALATAVYASIMAYTKKPDDSNLYRVEVLTDALLKVRTGMKASG